MKKNRWETGLSVLGPTLAHFAQRLETAGYAKETRRRYLEVTRRFDHYAARQAITLADLEAEHIERFVSDDIAGRDLCEGGRRARWRLGRQALSLLREHLRAEGLIAPGPTTPAPVLGSLLEGFAQHLEDVRHTVGTREAYLRMCRRFDEYLARERIALGLLRDEHVQAFLDVVTANPGLRDGGRLKRRHWHSPLARLLEYLRAEGVIPLPEPIAESLGPRVAEYLDFLREHRGMCTSTVGRQRRHVVGFLAEISAHTEDDLRAISIEQVDRHLVQASRRLGRESIGSLSSSLRGFLGYLHLSGVLPQNLRPHVATPHIYPLEAMPRAAAWSDVQRTIAGVDRTTPLGCRDYAMLVLIAHCGLRACDVAALRLQDLNWRHDVIHARRPKTDTSEDVPLIPIVGNALIAYLHQRPSSPHEEIFLTVKAPIRPLLSQRISWRVSGYLKRAGVKVAKLGSHTLRHSFAVELQRQGRSLKEIGDVLGQTHPRSTLIYAKANVERLREAALGIEGVLS